MQIFNRKILNSLVIIFFVFTTTMEFARGYIIYSISQSIPMGYKNEVKKKNFYVNLGTKQGLRKETVLDVYRKISRLDHYKTKKRYYYNVKIGELKVIHAEDNFSITKSLKLNINEESPLLEIENFMIGDNVDVKLSKE